MTRYVPKPVKIVAVLAALSALAYASCAPVDLLNGLTPNAAFNVSKNEAYGPLPEQALDVYIPKDPKPDAPLVMFVYGGGWNSGTKDIYKFMGQSFTQQGYTTVIPNYRTYPDVIYPDFVDDTAKAVAYTYQTYKKPMVIIGHSAGAHIASLLALDSRYLAAHELRACDVFTGWVGLAGPYDFKIYEEPYLSIFPAALRETEIQPISYAANSSVPAMVITGTDDETVGPDQTARMADALRAAPLADHAPVTYKAYEGVDHLEIMLRLSKVLRNDGQVHTDVMDFVNKRSSAAQCP